jgi:hypothetical protein
MTFTDLDPKTAPLVIDLQGGIVGLPLAHPADDVVSKSSALVKAFRRHGLPIVLVNVAGSPPGRTDTGSGGGQAFPDGWTDLIHELDQQPEDIIVTKYARSAFSGTGHGTPPRARSHAARYRRHRHQQRRRIDRQARARARFPCHSPRRRHDRPGPCLARAQCRPRVPPDR